jgi:hypothetical protein
VSDIDTAAADSLKALDPKRPIREADIGMRWSRKARLRMTRIGRPAVVVVWRINVGLSRAN